MEQAWTEFGANFTEVNKCGRMTLSSTGTYPTKVLSNHVSGMTQFPIFAGFQPATTRGTPTVFYQSSAHLTEGHRKQLCNEITDSKQYWLQYEIEYRRAKISKSESIYSKFQRKIKALFIKIFLPLDTSSINILRGRI